MDGVRFKVGDWVRRKSEFQAINWTFGSAEMRVSGVVPQVRGSALCLQGGFDLYDSDRFDLVRATLDPHALGMALVLADELIATERGFDAYEQFDVADWLRACVTEELLSQEAE